MKKIETSIRNFKPPEQDYQENIFEEQQFPQKEEFSQQEPVQQNQEPQNNQQARPQEPVQQNQEPHPTSNMSSEELAKMYEIYKQHQTKQQPQEKIQNNTNDFDRETYEDLQRRKQEFLNKDRPSQFFEDDMPKPPKPEKKGFLGLFKK